MTGRWRLALTVVMLAGWAGVMGSFFFTRVYIIDEEWFAAEATVMAERMRETGVIGFTRTQTNHLGYGTAYWTIFALAARASADPILPMRVLAFAGMLSVPVGLLVYAHRRGSSFGWAAVAIWLGTPMAWWTGKYAGPEMISVGLGMLGIVLAGTGRRVSTVFLGAAALGLAVGVKPNAAVMPVFAAVLVAVRFRPRIAGVAAFAAGLALGGAASNPFAVAEPGVYSKNLRQGIEGERKLEDVTRQLVMDVLNREAYAWDAVCCNGLFKFGPAAAALGMLGVLFLAGRLPAHVWIALLLAGAVAGYLILKSPVFLGWYWFPYIPLLLIPIADLRAPPGSPRAVMMAELAALAAGVNVGLGYPHIALQYRYKTQHVAGVRRAAECGGTAEYLIRSMPEPPKMVFQVTLPGIALPIPSARQLPDPLPGTPRPWAVRIWANAYTASNLIRAPGPKTDTILVIMQKSVAEVHNLPWYAFGPFTAQNPSGYVARFEIDNLFTAFVYKVAPFDPAALR